MARIRSVHPGLFTDEAFVTLSPFARLLVIGIWTECDDAGVFEWKPVTLKMRLLPVDNVDVPALLAECERANMLKRYSIDGREYGAVRNFRKYQRPKKPNCIHPMPDEFRTYVGLSGVGSEHDGDEDGAVPPKSEIAPQMEDGGWRGGEDEGGEDTSSLRSDDAREKPRGRRKRPATPLPGYWRPSEDLRRRCCALGLTEPELNRELMKFRNHAQQNDRRVSDWDAAFRNWCVKALELAGRDPWVNEEGETPTEVRAFVITPDMPNWEPWRNHFLAAGNRFQVSQMDQIAATCGQWTVPSAWPPGSDNAA